MHFEHETETESMIRQRVCERAYQLWEERGRPEGSPDEDWYLAEREIEGPKAAEPEPEFIYTASV
jgi:hypothetical protein